MISMTYHFKVDVRLVLSTVVDQSNKMNVGDHRIAVRYKVRGKLEVGQKSVALNLGVGLRSVKRLWTSRRQGKTLETEARFGLQAINTKNCKETS